MNSAKTLEVKYLYENRGFRNIKNAYLTPKEKDRLSQKVEKYL